MSAERNLSYDRLTFPSVRAALGWYFPAYRRMGSPNGMHPRTEQQPGSDTRLLLRVDGGGGGDLDEVLATLATITMALERVQQAEAAHLLPRHSLQVLLWSYRDGRTQADIAAALQKSQYVISVIQGRVDAYLLGVLGCPLIHHAG